MTTMTELQTHIDNLCPPEDEMPEYVAAILAEMNETRARYGYGPLRPDQWREVTEERACDSIAEFWVRHGRSLKEWDEVYPQILELFEGGDRAGRISMCDVVDTWEEDFGLTGEDFERLNGQIRGWIVSHSAAYGRIGR